MKRLIALVATGLLLDAASVAAQTGPAANGAIYSYAGNGFWGCTQAGGPATGAELTQPGGFAFDAAGNLYFADVFSNRIRMIDASTGFITTVAGKGTEGHSGDGGPAVNAELAKPAAVAVDGSGNLYIADTGNNIVRRVDALTGIIARIAGGGSNGSGIGDGELAVNAELSSPAAVMLNASGNIYIADSGNNRIRKVDGATGVISTVAGDGNPGYGGDGALATFAEIFAPGGIAFDAAGAIYFADWGNSRIRKVDLSSGIISTVAGIGAPPPEAGFSGDFGPATSAQLNQPSGLAFDGSGNLYIADSANNRIRRVDGITGIITTVAGDGVPGFAGDGTSAGTASIFNPSAVGFDSSWNLYIADFGNGRIRIVRSVPLIPTTTILTASASTITPGQQLTLAATVTAASGATPTGYVSFYTSNSSPGFAPVDESGVATITFTPAPGNAWYIATYSGSSTDAPSTSLPVNVHDTPPFIATTTRLSASAPSLIAGQSLTLTAVVTPAGGPTPSGTVSFLNGSAPLGTVVLNSNATASLTFTPPAGVYSITASYSGSSTDEASVSSAVSVSVIAPSGTPFIYQYAGDGNLGGTGDNCLAANAELDPTYSLATDPAGNLYIADTAGNRVRRIDRTTGIITTYAGTGTPGFSGDNGPAASAQLAGPLGIAFDSAGNLYISDNHNYRIRRVDTTTGNITTVAGKGTSGFGGDNGLATNAEFGQVYGVAVDSDGNLYIGDGDNFRVRKVDAATGIISTIAGNGMGGIAGDDGPSASAELSGQLFPAVDAAGNIYIADTGNVRIREVNAATGVITTVAGDGSRGYSGDGGLAVDAELSEPLALVSDAAGNITFVDSLNNRVRRIDAASGIITTVAGDGVLGFGPIGVPAINSALDAPSAVAIDPMGNMYIDVQGAPQILIVGAQPSFPPIATSISLTASATALQAGEPLSLSATVTASACATPDGTVTFLTGTEPLGSASLNGSGVATLSLVPQPGTYSVTASYDGNSVDAPSVSTPILVSVTGNLNPTTTLLTGTPPRLNFGQSLTLTATVSASSGSSPSGFVTFSSGTSELGSGTLNATGIAALQIAPAAGSYSITAHYSGSLTDSASTSAPAPVTVEAATTSTSLLAAQPTVSQGQPITLTSTVIAATGPTPAGTVTLYLNGTQVSSTAATLNANGSASVTLTTLPTGIYDVFASYPGTANDAPSTSSHLTVTVTLPTTETTLTPSPNPAAFGASVTFTAQVSNTASIPTGAIALYDGTTRLATEPLVSGLAQFTTSELSAGSHQVKAVYTPSPAFSASQSPVLVEVVSLTSFSISAGPSSRSVYTGEAAAYSLNLTSASGFTLAVTLSCSQLPADTTCAFAPASLSGGNRTSNLVIQTQSPSPSATRSASFRTGSAGVLTALLILLIPRRQRQFTRVCFLLLATVAFCVLSASVTACANGPLSGGTPVGSHTILLTGTASNGSATLSQNTTITLVVNSLF